MLDINRAIDIMQTALLRDIGDDVDLIFRFGSMLRGNTHAYSDLDLAYVPREGAPYHAITVMVNDLLIDLFPMGWSRLEQMAEFESVNATLLLRNEIIYQRDQAAAARFRALGERVRELQRPEARPEMLRKAQAIFERTSHQFYLLYSAVAAGDRLASFFHTRRVLDSMLHCLGVVNQVAVDTRKLAEVLALPKLPPDFAALVRDVSHATEAQAMLAAGQALMEAVRRLLVAEQEQVLRREIGYPEVFDSGYPELKGDLQHVMLACERRDWFDLKLFSFYHEWMIHMAEAETGVSYSGFNSLMDYEQDLAALEFPDLVAPVVDGDFDELHRQCRAFDVRMREFLSERNVVLNYFLTLDDLRLHLGV